MTEQMAPRSARAVPVPFDQAVARYEPVIGLETHVELGTVAKMFCGCPTVFGSEPNAAVCPVCLGLPGSLPVINKAAIEYTIKIGLALNCSIAQWCRFARKNYFTRTCRRTSRSRSMTSRCARTAGSTSRRAASGGGLASNGSTWRKTPASHCTSAARPAVSTVPITPCRLQQVSIPLVEVVTKPIGGTGSLAPVVARAYVTELRDLVRALGVSPTSDGAGLASLRRQHVDSTRRGRALGDEDRDQERQLAALGRAGGAL
jgi:aspartyl-tRNA(Asn)/glutamyl-tRNA(Gln) amidotransferase subunit B